MGEKKFIKKRAHQGNEGDIYSATEVVFTIRKLCWGSMVYSSVGEVKKFWLWVPASFLNRSIEKGLILESCHQVQFIFFFSLLVFENTDNHKNNFLMIT